MEKVEILGVQIDNLSLQEVLEQADRFINSENQHYVVTANPEFLVAAEHDSHFKEILNYSDIAVADGVGLIKAAKFQGQNLQRVTGVDLVWSLAELAEQKNYSVYLLGAWEGVAQAAADVLTENFPNLNVSGADDGGVIIDPTEINQKLINQINFAKPQILFVAFGQVKQEKWIFYNLDRLPSVRLAIGVGGAFDYISGSILRAPAWMQKIGLEWLFRLINEPNRWPRICTAVFVFPFLIIKKRLLNAGLRKNRDKDR
ncbi:MAG: WecB/TagA/CpsF family glycosyltransferase [Patescibacteria group bacterium]|nr:WecB/TagA/CpsF family glycosyltransferase [Patescibacteria group bacterium]